MMDASTNWDMNTNDGSDTSIIEWPEPARTGPSEAAYSNRIIPGNESTVCHITIGPIVTMAIAITLTDRLMESDLLMALII